MITIGDFSFENHVGARETFYIADDKVEHEVLLSGTIQCGTASDINAALDGLQSIATSRDAIPLSLRAGHEIKVRCTEFRRESPHEVNVGAFVLRLNEARGEGKA